MTNCGCDSAKNQTGKEVFEFCENKKLSIFDTSSAVLGIGLFHVPAPEKPGLNSAKVVAVDGLSYAECRVRGQSCLGFKWFPKGFEITVDKNPLVINSVEDIRKWSTLSKCSDHRCSGGSGCPNPCFCNQSWNCDKID